MPMPRLLDPGSKMQQRAKRDNGAKFDQLIRGARAQAGDPAEDLARINRDGLGPAMGPKRPKGRSESVPDGLARSPKYVSVQLVGGHSSGSSNLGVWSARRLRRSMTRGVRL